MTQILGISGSLRRDSFNSAALRAAQDLAPNDMDIVLADLSQIPLYDQDLFDQKIPTAVEHLSRQIAEADGLLFATPEYNYSVSGVLKNAIDWVSRQKPHPFAGKPAAVMSASMSLFGGARTQYDLRRILVSMDVHFLNRPEVMIAQAHERFDRDGRLTHEATRDFVGQLLTALHDWTGRIQSGGQQK